MDRAVHHLKISAHRKIEVEEYWSIGVLE